MRRLFWTVIPMLLAILIAPEGFAAQEVGGVSEVLGRVDILREGKLPALPAEVGGKIYQGDIIRTKSESKVKLHFADDSILSIAPNSRVAINEYLYAPDQNQRRAGIKIFYGLVHTLVTKIFKKEAPDFVVETQTAVIGVRGTDYYTVVAPDASDIYNNTGITEVTNIFPEIVGKARLEGKAYTRVATNLPPTLPLPLTQDDLRWLEGQMSPKVISMRSQPGSEQMFSKAAASTVQAASLPTTVASQLAGQLNPVQNLQSAVYVPPQPAPTPISTPYYILAYWGTGATDLDLHLTGPDASRFHVYYAEVGSSTAQPYSLYHYDAVVANGSEVISIAKFNQGDVYRASVYNYSDPSYTSTNLSTTSGVTMQLIEGGKVVTATTPYNGVTVEGGKVLQTITPVSGQAGNTWRAAEINPSTGQINTVNQILNSANSASVQ